MNKLIFNRKSYELIEISYDNWIVKGPLKFIEGYEDISDIRKVERGFDEQYQFYEGRGRSILINGKYYMPKRIEKSTLYGKETRKRRKGKNKA